MTTKTIDAILCRVKQADKTVGKLFDLTGKEYNTVELPWNDNKVGLSCIKDGIYPFVKEYSPHAKKERIELKLVEGRSEIQVHSGVKVSDVKGCVACGTSEDEKAFFNAMPAHGRIQVTSIKL